MRAVKIRNRLKSCSCFEGRHTGAIADTPKPCSSPACCGNRRISDGDTKQELAFSDAVTSDEILYDAILCGTLED